MTAYPDLVQQCGHQRVY